MPQPPTAAAPKGQLRTLVLGGLLPVIIFTVIENYYGTLAGLIAGMVFGVGEIAYEYIRDKKVSAITLGANALILILGGISLLSSEGFWFKLQPAIMEAVFAVILVGSYALGKPFMVLMADKQNLWAKVQPEVKPILQKKFSGLTFRLGIFFLVHAVIATWAAFKWSTTAWAFLKGFGFTGSFFVYMFAEIIWMRRKPKKS